MNMRTTLLLSLFLLIAAFSPLRGQYLPFGVAGSKWKIDFFDADIPSQCGGTTTSIFEITDTVTFVGQTYKAIAFSSRGICQVASGFSNVCGLGPDSLLIRTDTATGQVLGWFPGASAETELFDYSLKPGDTVADSVDTILLNGLSRKRLFYANGAGTLIEGSGASSGLGFPLGNGINGEGSVLVCYSENSAPLAGDPNSCSSGGDCLALNLISPQSNTGFWWAPNPAQGRFHFGGSLYSPDATIQVFDTSGKLYWQQQAHEGTISVADWPAGIYYIRNETGEGGLLQVVH